jgi:predicted metal-dependent hydrolase
MINEHQPTVICFVGNLYFSVKIENSIHGLNYESKLIEKSNQITLLDNNPIHRRLTEPLEGAGAVLVEKITQWQPVLMIFDLDNTDVPWSDWIAILKSASDTRRIPILCYGSHKDKNAIQIAHEAGADVVFSRGQFFSELQVLIKKYAREYDYELINNACSESLSELALIGIEEFNNRNYFEAHEYLEDAWNEDGSIGRELYRAILQVAVAYLHIERNNYRGAMKMFLRVRQWIDPLPSICRGVDVAQLRDDAYRVRDALSKLNANNLDEFDRDLLRPIKLASASIE